jgi:transcriptional regulator with XRE-family HTH domain
MQTNISTPSRLRARRESLGWSRAELGERAGGVSTSAIRRLELGQARPHRSTLSALAFAMRCQPEDIRPVNETEPGA